MTFYDGRGHLTPAAPEERRWKSVHKSQRSALLLPQKKNKKKDFFPVSCSLVLFQKRKCTIPNQLDKFFSMSTVCSLFSSTHRLSFSSFSRVPPPALSPSSLSHCFRTLYTCKLGTIRAGEREVYNGCRLYPNIYNSAILAIKTCAPFPPTKSEMLIVKGREKTKPILAAPSVVRRATNLQQ